MTDSEMRKIALELAGQQTHLTDKQILAIAERYLAFLKGGGRAQEEQDG